MTTPVTSWPKFGEPFPSGTLQQIQSNNPYTKPVAPPCPCPDPGAICLAQCNENIKQHNLNCRVALKLYIQYLKEQGCDVKGCTIKEKKGCKTGKKLCVTQTGGCGAKTTGEGEGEGGEGEGGEGGTNANTGGIWQFFQQTAVDFTNEYGGVLL